MLCAVSVRALESPFPLYLATRGPVTRPPVPAPIADGPPPPARCHRSASSNYAALERGFSEAQLQLCEKVVNGKKPFNPMPLDAVVVEDQDRRRPVHVQALADAFIEDLRDRARARESGGTQK